jgi:type II secretory pathway predicted ATPase ExeA
MDPAYFRMHVRPFRGTPDTQFYYPATPHEFVLGRITRALEDDEGIVLLTGEPGSGKTLVAHLLLERLGDTVNAALITNCRFATRADLLRSILFDLARPYQGLGEHELRLALTDHVLTEFAAGKRTLLVMDEAQDLTADVLEELRLLGNLETGRGKAVQVVLVSQPAILETLRQPPLVVFNQRLAVRLRLDALDIHESADYVLHQVRTAGGRPERVFTDEAATLLAKHVQGVPRLINQTGHQALTLAESLGLDQIDAEVVLEALAAIGIEVDLSAGDEDAGPALFATAPVGAGIDGSMAPARAARAMFNSAAPGDAGWNAAGPGQQAADLPARMVYGPDVNE